MPVARSARILSRVGSIELLPQEGTETRLAPRWHVVLLDDDDHTYDYVIEMLGRVFGHPAGRAQRMAEEVDGCGRCIVWTGPLETAEFKQERIHGYGADPRLARSSGSMSATLEPAD